MFFSRIILFPTGGLSKFVIFISRGAEGPGREILQRPLSVCLFSFRTVTQKRIDFFLKTLQVRAPCHGGVLYSFLILMEFCLNFL